MPGLPKPAEHRQWVKPEAAPHTEVNGVGSFGFIGKDAVTDSNRSIGYRLATATSDAFTPLGSQENGYSPAAHTVITSGKQSGSSRSQIRAM